MGIDGEQGTTLQTGQQAYEFSVVVVGEFVAVSPPSSGLARVWGIKEEQRRRSVIAA